MRNIKYLWKGLNKETSGIARLSGSVLNKQKNPLTPLPPTQQTPPPIPPEKQQAREMAIWHTIERWKPPQKGKAPDMAINAETGLEIMNPVDYSGFNHLLLKRHDYDHPVFYKIYGSFTTSFSPFKGKKPVWVANITLEGGNKKQYLHVYDSPKLLKKSDVVESLHFTTMFLTQADMDDLVRKYRNSTFNDNDPI